MNPKRRWMSGSSRLRLATSMVAVSSRCTATESLAPASESRNRSSASRSATSCADSAGGRGTVETAQSRAQQERKRRKEEGEIHSIPFHYTPRPTQGSPADVSGPSEVRPNRRVRTWARSSASRRVGQRLGHTESQAQRQVVAHREVGDQLDADRAQAVEPRRRTWLPRIAHIPEGAQPQAVDAEWQMTERLPDQGERHAVFHTRSRGSPAEQGTRRVAAHGEGAGTAGRRTESQGEDASRYAAHAVRRGDRTRGNSGGDAQGEYRMRVALGSGYALIDGESRADLVRPAQGSLLLPAPVQTGPHDPAHGSDRERPGGEVGKAERHRPADPVPTAAPRTNGGERGVGSGDEAAALVLGGDSQARARAPASRDERGAERGRIRPLRHDGAGARNSDETPLARA